MSSAIVNVLLVDDDEIDVESVLRSFEEAKLANPITVASDGKQALEILRGSNGNPPMRRPYLILLDINMPCMNGIEFLDALRRDPVLADSVVFMLTTSANPEDRKAAYEHQVAGYLIKDTVGPDFDTVLSVVQTYQHAVVLPA